MEKDKKQEFVFLYPIPSYFTVEGRFHKNYKKLLNQCIDVRYRQKNFNINVGLNSRDKLSDILEFQPSDRILRMNLDFDFPSLANQLDKDIVLRIGGFHLFDCVSRFAEDSIKSGIKDVKVDEDLTELFTHYCTQPNFDINKTPNIDLSTLSPFRLEQYISARHNRPYLHQVSLPLSPHRSV